MADIVFCIKCVNNPGGTERVLSVVSSELAERGNIVNIISITGAGAKPFHPFSDKVRIHYLLRKDNSISPFRELRRRHLLRKLYDSLSPDVIVMVDSRHAFLAKLSNHGYKTIIWEHFNILRKNSIRSVIQHRIASTVSDMIVTLTQRDADAYKLIHGAKRTMCIPNPVTVNASGRTDYDASRRVLLNPARICPQKRQDLLVRAWALSRGASLGWTLDIVGYGEPRRIKALEDLISTVGVSDSVRIFPPDKGIVSRYNGAGVVVLSSQFEGFPLVLIEAQAMGVPQLSFDCPTGPSEIIVDGKTGFLVRHLDVEGLAQAMDRLMTDENLRLSFSRESLTHAEEFSLGKISAMWQQLIDSMI